MKKSLNYNHSTGEIIERDLTLDEITELNLLAEQVKIKENKIAEKATARQAVLDRLGITAEEAQLIIGGSN